MQVADEKRRKTCVCELQLVLDLTSDWMIKWYMFFKPIAQHSDAILMKMQILTLV